MRYCVILPAILCLILAGIQFISPALAHNGHQKKIYVVIRYDDCSARSSTALESKIIKALKERNMTATIGVIPYIRKNDGYTANNREGIPLTAEKIKIFKAAADSNILEIAQHGYSHDNVLALQQKHNTNPIRSELIGLSYAEQLKIIGGGKAALEKWFGRKVTTFIPPYNTYDKNTVRALATLGYKTHSGGIDYYYPVNNAPELRQIPATTSFPVLEEAVSTARHSGDYSPLLVILMHPEDFIEINEDTAKLTVADLNKKLDWLQAQKDVKIISVSKAAEILPDLGPGRLNANNQARTESAIVPGFLRPNLDNVYFSTSEIQKLELNKNLATSLYFLIIALFSFIVSYIMVRMIVNPEILNPAKRAGIVLFIVFMLYAMRDLRIGVNAVLGFSAFVGACMAAIYATRHSNVSIQENTEQRERSEIQDVENRASL